MALKILLADSDRQWLATTKQELVSGGYGVDFVENGKEVQLKLYNEEFFSCVINFSIENYTLLQVLKFIKNNVHNAMTVVVVVNEDVPAEDINESTIKKLGVAEVIYKKDGHKALVEALEGHLSLGDIVQNLPKREGVSEEVEVNEEDAEFTSIKIDEFVAGKNVLFDVFVRLSSGKYIKILHAGDTFSKDRIDKYRQKKVSHLFFKTNDRKRFVQYQSFVTRKMVHNKRVPVEYKEQLLKNTAEKYVEELFSRGIKPQVIEQGKEICETIYHMIDKEKKLHELLKKLNSFDPNAFNHSYSVTLFASAIIKQFEWQSKVTIETTSLACMLHDLGKLSMPPGLIDRHPSELKKEEELEAYYKHPEEGAKMIEGNRLISNSVQQIILQHHECYDGTGFPRGVKGSKILTLANIVRLADDFVRLVEEKQCSTTEALKIMLQDRDMVKRYNSHILENFIKVFVDPEKLAGSEKKSVIPSNSRVVKKH